MRKLLTLTLTLLFLAPATTAVAAEASAQGAQNPPPERGYWFYKDPKPEEEEEPIFVVSPKKKEEAEVKPPERDCSDPKQWVPECGFIDPGRSFEFQAKQRDALLTEMVMNPDRPKAVEAFQYYSKWIMDQASRVASMWEFNRLQNPELDPQATRPVTRFGLKLLAEVDAARAEDIFRFIKENGFLVYFSRTDCSYCHDMIPVLEYLDRNTGLPIVNASLDETCMPGFAFRECMAAPATIKPAQLLEVSTVPAMFVYLEPDVWVRIGNGVSTSDTLQARIVNFVSAYRSALVNGVNNGEGWRAPVDFSTEPAPADGRGLGAGVTPADNPLPPADFHRLFQGDGK